MVRRERRGTNTRALLVAMLGLLLLASPAGLLPWSQGSAEPSTVLRIGFMQKVDSLNPNLGLTEASSFFYSLVYDSLQSVDEDLNPSPNLASEWWIVPESDSALELSGEPYGSVWQYNLTRNTKWHDGNLFTADDVVFTINMNCQNYDWMWAYQPYSHFMQNAEKIDDYTVRIHFYDRETNESVPVAFADTLMIPILPWHKLADMSASELAFMWNGIFAGEDPPVVGTGPFMVTDDIWEEWIGGDSITLVRNPDYHGFAADGDSAYIDGILMMFYDDATSMMLSLEASDIDVAEFPPASYAAIEQKIATGQLKNVVAHNAAKLTGMFDCVSFNVNGGGLWGGPGPNPSIWDPDIRRALSMATNRSHIVDEIYMGYADEGSTLLSPAFGEWHYEPSELERWSFDIDSANALLDSAGYLDTDSDGVREATDESYAVEEGLVEPGTPLVYDMIIRDDPPYDRDVAMYLKEQWEEIGVGLEYSVYTGWYMYALCPYDTDMGTSTWSSDPDPNYLLFCQSLRAHGGWSDNRYASEEYNENYNMSFKTLDPEERLEYVHACQRAHYLDAVYLILAYPDQTYVWRNDTFSDNFWGDWAAHPGRSLDNIWGAHPLWFYEPPEPDQGWTLTTEQKAVILGVVAVVIAAEAVLIWRKYRRPAPPAGPE